VKSLLKTYNPNFLSIFLVSSFYNFSLNYYFCPYLRPFRASAGLFVARAPYLSIEQCDFIKSATMDSMDNNNTWSKVQNVVVRESQGEHAFNDEPRDERLASFRCDELAKVAPLYKKAVEKNRRDDRESNAKLVDKARRQVSPLLNNARCSSQSSDSHPWSLFSF